MLSLSWPPRVKGYWFCTGVDEQSFIRPDNLLTKCWAHCTKTIIAIQMQWKNPAVIHFVAINLLHNSVHAITG